MLESHQRIHSEKKIFPQETNELSSKNLLRPPFNEVFVLFGGFTHGLRLYFWYFNASQNKMKWIYTQMLEILNEDTTTYSLLQADRIRLFHFFVRVSTWCPPYQPHRLSKNANDFFMARLSFQSSLAAPTSSIFNVLFTQSFTFSETRLARFITACQKSEMLFFYLLLEATLW